MDQALMKQITQKVQEELLKKEIEVVQYWLAEMERVLGKKHQDMASLQVDLGHLIQKFQNRIRILKTSRMA